MAYTLHLIHEYKNNVHRLEARSPTDERRARRRRRKDAVLRKPLWLLLLLLLRETLVANRRDDCWLTHCGGGGTNIGRERLVGMVKKECLRRGQVSRCLVAHYGRLDGCCFLLVSLRLLLCDIFTLFISLDLLVWEEGKKTRSFLVWLAEGQEMEGGAELSG